MRRLIVWYAEPGQAGRMVCGLSQIKRAVLTAQKAELESVAIRVPGADSDVVRAELNDRRITIPWSLFPDTPVIDAGLAPDGSSLGLVLGDRVFLKDALTDLAAAPIGSQLGQDSGLFHLSPALAQGHAPTALSTTTHPATKRWITLGDDVYAAETLLIRSLTKDADGIISRNINRKISGAVTRRLAPKKIHPNQVTAIVAIIGIAAWPAAATGSYFGIALGGFLYYLSAILDGVDGELSRLKYLGSPLGAWLDTVTDDVVCASFLIGLYTGLGTRSAHWTWIGGITVAAFLLTVLPRYYLMIISGSGGDHQQIAAASAADTGEKTAFNKLVDLLAKTVFRTDFLPWFAFVTAALAIPGFFGWAFAIGSVLAMIETGFTVVKFKKAQATS